jgi:HSP20 family protein
MTFNATGKGGPAWYSGFSYMMNVNLVETRGEYKIFADLPGVELNDISITTGKHSITIKATRKWCEGEGAKLIARELPLGEVRRTVNLPRDTDVVNARATFRNGVSEIACQKGKSLYS